MSSNKTMDKLKQTFRVSKEQSKALKNTSLDLTKTALCNGHKKIIDEKAIISFFIDTVLPMLTISNEGSLKINNNGDKNE